MKHYLLITLFFIASFTLHAQTIIDSAHVDYRPYKGKLIVINEIHNVASNTNVYQHIIEDIASQLQKGDTINIIGEWPFSFSETQQIEARKRRGAKVHTNFYPLGLPVRMIGVDFERLYKKEDNTYTAYIDSLVTILGKQNIATDALTAYNDKIKEGTISKGKDRKPLIALYKKQRKMFDESTIQYKTVTRLLFLLTGSHEQLPNMRKRDKGNYARLLEANESGIINFKNNYNILIHGTCHTDPTKKNDIYNYFQNNSSSPFKDNTYMIAQSYIDCTSTGDYFRDTPRNVTGSIFCNGPDLPITDFFRARYKGVVYPKTVVVTKAGNTIPELAPYKDRIIAHFIHWRVPAQNNSLKK